QLSTSSCQLLIVVHTTKTYLTAPCSTSVDLSVWIVSMIGPQLSATQYFV
ncbi:unnamed protein product, partial [Rotaria sp. Silwood2]